MAALGSVPTELQILNLGLTEIGGKINQIKRRLDKTEDLVNSLAEMKLKQGTSLMLERQMDLPETEETEVEVDDAYLIEMPTAIVLTLGTAVLTGLVFSLVTYLHDQLPCNATNTNTTDIAVGTLCSVLSQPLLLSQALVLGPILAFTVATGLRIAEVEFL